MSRSYKHTPHCYYCSVDSNPGHRKSWKSIYNRSLRHKYNDIDPLLLDEDDDYDDDYGDGRQYKKMNCRWNIDDGGTVYPLAQYRHDVAIGNANCSHRQFVSWFLGK